MGPLNPLIIFKQEGPIDESCLPTTTITPIKGYTLEASHEQ
jgi:hypothetical protein